MSKAIEERLAARQQQATASAQAASQPASVPANNSQARAETPAEQPAAKPAVVRQARPVRAPSAPEKPAEMSKAMRSHWRTTLQNAALKLAADRARLDESEQAWADTVAEARTLGVAANVIVAAAAYADIELPE